MQTKQIRIGEILTEERFIKLANNLTGLPDGDEFRNRIEKDLWETFTGSQSKQDSIAYDALSGESKSIIGYIEEGENVPWWLSSFRWDAQSRGETITLEKMGRTDTLANLENFDPEATEIIRPVLRDSTITDVLDAIRSLTEALADSLDVDKFESQSTFQLPADIFNIQMNTLETTSNFERWFSDLFQLCPPMNDELTTLLMVNAGISWEAAQGVLPENVLEQLKALGFPEEKIFDYDYHNALQNILAIDGVFDLRVPVNVEYEELGALEALLYEVWAETHREQKDMFQEWIKQASDWNPDTLEPGEEPHFARIAFTAPLRLNRQKPIYATLRILASSSSGSGYYQRDQGKRKEINQILSAYLE